MEPDWKPVDPAVLKLNPSAPPMQKLGDLCRTCHGETLRALPRMKKEPVLVCVRCDSLQIWPLHV